MKSLFRKTMRFFRRYGERRCSTLSGGLAFFLVLSIVPFAFWLIMVYGDFEGELNTIYGLNAFGFVKPFAEQIANSAKNLSSNYSALYLAVSIYSASSFFFHLRRTGDMILRVEKRISTVKQRIIAVLFVIVAIIAACAALIVFAFGVQIFGRFLNGFFSVFLNYLLLSVLSFAFSFMLNVYVFMPIEHKLRELILGSAVTSLLYILVSAGFSLYLNFSNWSNLYGVMANFIVMILWIYVLISVFWVGILINDNNVIKKYDKKML